MSNNDNPIVPPKSRPVHALGRATAEDVADLIPGAGLVANIWRVTHPSIEEIDRKRWEEQVTQRSNELDVEIKRVLCAFLKMRANFQRVSEAQNLSFIRGGMISTLEAISRDGLTPDLRIELRRKLDETAGDVEDILKGLEEALLGMTDDERQGEFADILGDTVFGSFGKSSIRDEMEDLLGMPQSSIDRQRQVASLICASIDRFNTGLLRLSAYAAASIGL